MLSNLSKHPPDAPLPDIIVPPNPSMTIFSNLFFLLSFFHISPVLPSTDSSTHNLLNSLKKGNLIRPESFIFFFFFPTHTTTFIHSFTLFSFPDVFAKSPPLSALYFSTGPLPHLPDLQKMPEVILGTSQFVSATSFYFILVPSLISLYRLKIRRGQKISFPHMVECFCFELFFFPLLFILFLDK